MAMAEPEQDIGMTDATEPEEARHGPQDDGLFAFDPEQQRRLVREKPWAQDPQYFKRVRISTLALLKMLEHVRSGGTLEVMGLMRGVVDGDAFIVLDAFALPVEGTETNVNAQAQAYEYMVEHTEELRRVGRQENVVGWYHSHPGYGCWLSGTDVRTQMDQQQFTDPYLAVVIDPNKTMASGKVDIGAFRTLPEGQKIPVRRDPAQQGIPLAKSEDFGHYADRYYALHVSYFKSSLDTEILDRLWVKYWVNTISNSHLDAVGNTFETQINRQSRDYDTSRMKDLAEKLELISPAPSVSTTPSMAAPVPVLPGPGVSDASSRGARKPKTATRDAAEALLATTTSGPGSSSMLGGRQMLSRSGPRIQHLTKTMESLLADETQGMLAEAIRKKLFHGDSTPLRDIVDLGL